MRSGRSKGCAMKNQCHENSPQERETRVKRWWVGMMWMIAAHAMQHARATIVTRRGETRKAEPGHDFDVVLRHRAERVIRVIRDRYGFGRIAVTAKIGADDGERLRQNRRDTMP